MIRFFVLAAAATALVPAATFAQVVYGWGYNGYGQFGNGANIDSNAPAAGPTAGAFDGKTITVIAAGAFHSLALANGQAFAWGYNADGELGNGTTTNSYVPMAVSTAGGLSGQTITAVVGGYEYTLALANGQVYAWGNNGSGQLGVGTTNNTNVPVAVSTAGALGGQRVTAIAAGYQHSLAVANGKVFAWGFNLKGELGDGTTTQSSVPVAVSTVGVLNGQMVATIAGGGDHSLALANGRIYAWGYNGYGQLGNGVVTDSSVPVAVYTSGVLAGKTVTAIAAGAFHSLAVANGQVYAWGYNNDGELGIGITAKSTVPVAVSSLVLSSLQVTEVAAAEHSSYALTSTGRLFVWGDNTYGELGIGSAGGYLTTPQEVLPPSGFVWTGVSSESDSVSVLAIAMPVPEPGTLGLIAAAGLAAVAFRRHKNQPHAAAP